MTDLTERLQKRIADASPLPWVYRPDKYDDWGWIRGVEQESEIGRYRPIVANAKDSNVREDAFAQHRQNKTDPYGPNALLITEGLNALPDLLTTLETLTQENARLREALGRVVSVDQERHWTATKENPETHWEIMDGQCARIARKALGGGDE